MRWKKILRSFGVIEGLVESLGSVWLVVSNLTRFGGLRREVGSETLICEVLGVLCTLEKFA